MGAVRPFSERGGNCAVSDLRVRLSQVSPCARGARENFAVWRDVRNAPKIPRSTRHTHTQSKRLTLRRARVETNQQANLRLTRTGAYIAAQQHDLTTAETHHVFARHILALLFEREETSEGQVIN